MKTIILAFMATLSLSASADDLKYGPKLNSAAPQIKTQDIDGASFNLSAQTKKGPVVLVFYRGGWCPYCNTQLRKLERKVAPPLDKLGAKLVAISVDRVDVALKSRAKQKFNFQVISDTKADIVKRYGLVNQLSNELVKKYKDSYKIDVEKDSGETHHIVAVPAVIVVDQKGIVRYRYADSDYKKRAPEADIIAAVAGLNKTK